MEREREGHSVESRRQLRRENARLYRRIEELETALARARSESGAKGQSGGAEAGAGQFHAAIRRLRLFSAGGYGRYVAALVQTTSLWAQCQRVRLYLRRYRLLTTVFRVATRVVTLAETSAVFLVWLSVSLVLLPILVLLMLMTLFFAFVRSDDTNRRLRTVLTGERVVLVPAERRQLKNSGYFRAMVKDFAADGAICLVISPYFFAPRGLGGKGYYVTARREYERVYLVRKHYYFAMRRALLGKRNVAADVTYVY